MSLGDGFNGSEIVWGDENHIDVCHSGYKGADVFQYEQKACDKLDAYVENDENANFGFEEEIEKIRKKLALADKILAETAIAEGGNSEEIAVAEELFTEGEAIGIEQGGSAICDVALDKFEEVWEKSVKSWCAIE